MLTQRGIEANPEKCKAIIEMRSPTTIKEVQCLIGRLTAISRFLPKLAEQTQPIIQLLKKIRPVHVDKWLWTDIPKTKNNPNLPTYPPQAGHPSTPTRIHHSHWPYSQRHAGPRNRRHIVSCVFREQNVTRPWNQISNGRKAGPIFGPRGTPSTPIFPKPHHNR